jgi:hypothetical protein
MPATPAGRAGYLLAVLSEVYGLPVSDFRLITAAARDLTAALDLRRRDTPLLLIPDMRVAA